ncbi:hypothetical protein [Leisingera sp. ANG-M1]|uniref:hypothetical protein n=1 Tax=Leisingera sp. ANG-M1 TaxID=1577895 RepID=UPI00126A288C|nr:hypothetical protein [Leisingera sp. ANG-M1]
MKELRQTAFHGGQSLAKVPAIAETHDRGGLALIFVGRRPAERPLQVQVGRSGVLAEGEELKTMKEAALLAIGSTGLNAKNAAP